jgi:DNA-binding NarL/FixJ family response regulator
LSDKPAEVLVVDDDALFCEAAALTLRSAGFVAHERGSIESASDVLRERRIDLLIADLQMPGNAGLEWLCAVTGDHSQLAVILCTGYPTLETAITAVGLPIRAYLVKPVTPERLVESARAAIACAQPSPESGRALPELLEAESRRYGLSRRQTQVLELLARGLSNKEIARELGCALRTAELHVSELLRRAGAESRASLIARLLAPYAPASSAASSNDRGG